MNYTAEDLAVNKDLAIILLNDNKAPIQLIGKEHYKRVSDEEIISHLHGFGLLMGNRSQFGGAFAEAIDIDLKYDLTGNLWKEYKKQITEVAPGLLKKLAIHKTVNNGYHFIYRCSIIEGNKKLAKRRDDSITKSKVLIETRGEGGYIVVPPTVGYECVYNSILDIPEISIQEREVLFNCARIFNEMDDSEVRGQLSSDRRMYNKNATRHEDDNPFEEYNKRGNVLKVLTDNGWIVTKEKGTKKLLKRPGETSNNWSADLDIIEGIIMFHVYTSSTQFEVDKTYTPSQVYTMLVCDNDWTIAARQLRKDGFAKLPGKKRDVADIEFVSRPGEEIEGDLKKLRITSKTDIPPLYELIGIRDTLVLSRGNVMALSGSVKTGKSAIINILLSKAMTSEASGFPDVVVKENRGGKPVIHIDTEQSISKHKENIMKWILPRTGFQHTPDFFYSYNFRTFTVRQARESLVWLLARLHKKCGGIHLVFIDGISEFVRSPNDEEGSYTLIKLLMELSAQYDTGIVVVIHTNPVYEGTRKERGHLGSELQRKAESVLSIENDNTDDRIKIMKARWLRNGNTVDFGEIHYSFDLELMRHEQIDKIEKETEYNMLKRFVSKMRNNMSVPEAKIMLMQAINVSANKATGMIRNMKSLNLIQLQDDRIFKAGIKKSDDDIEADKDTCPF